MSTYLAFIPQGKMDPTITDKVKEFILAVSLGSPARWPSFYGVLLRDGKPVIVKSGDSYADYGNEFYMRHQIGAEIPTWLPPVLSCMAQFCQIGGDQEVRQAIIEIAAKMAADIFRPLRTSIIQAPEGIDIVNLAINDETRQIAGLYPPDPNDPEALPIARLPFSGEIVNISDDRWHTFSIQS